jgi:hypothetical protein
MATEEKAPPGVPPRYTLPPNAPSPPPSPRDPAALITELLRPRAAPTRSREEQAFIDLQRGCHQ